MAEEYLLTKEGYDNLVKELEVLKKVKRPEIVERIKIAREFGDLSENAEYEAAKNEQSAIEGSILEKEALLKMAKIIDDSKIDKSKVYLGATVEVYDKEFDEIVKYEIVGTSEVDMKNNRISNESPIGRALMGKGIGETAVINAPAGKIRLEIKSII